ncbi:Lycopene beta-cyclase [Massarina eburnea CBS 473.64]|uniref:Bifunctional lycopene cyclase/phytoene synthase n=1 Tax=Massarina eburnea CBS 473.64 TaxID=1395130 RepID=A0A6A6S5N6_9PLEO|nr:Lycopene beta-cyclase [Massarina eburnea CBS 473.64]
MGFDYALVHVKYNIPPAVLLTVLYWPLQTRRDVYKIAFLITIAVTSTIPWDSYLIRTHIWSYPSHVIIGPKLFDIPLEEVFFFIIQTYSTTLLYFISSKPTFQPIHLRIERGSASRWPCYRRIGQAALLGVIAWGWYLIKTNHVGTYTGLILVWACPFILLLWTLAYQFIIGLPLSNTLLPIAISTIYLWIVDTLALKRGTWVINTGTKYGIHLWDGLEIEEAIFFLLTNTLIVFGQLAFDNALAILDTFPHLFPGTLALPSPYLLIRALLTPTSKYDEARLLGLQEAVVRLKRKSRSFYLASATFHGKIRADLMLLYSFCRVADDLVDESSSLEEATKWIAKINKFLELAYTDEESTKRIPNYVRENFPPETQSAFLQLPFHKLSPEPLKDLLRGFNMDLEFSTLSPIQTEADLDAYAHRVAGTVAQMCNELIFHIHDPTRSTDDKQRIIEAGDRMGIALQCINIARDITVDANMIGRVYLPLDWLKEAGLTYNDVITNPHGPDIETLRRRLLSKAFKLYEGARDAIEELPIECRRPIRVAVESYMEIGRVLQREGYVVKAGRATVPKMRRLRVAWAALRR